MTRQTVRAGLRIRERHPDGQDRRITSVRPGVAIDCVGVVSGRATSVAWSKIGRYNIVEHIVRLASHDDTGAVKT